MCLSFEFEFEFGLGLELGLGLGLGLGSEPGLGLAFGLEYGLGLGLGQGITAAGLTVRPKSHCRVMQATVRVWRFSALWSISHPTAMEGYMLRRPCCWKAARDQGSWEASTGMRIGSDARLPAAVTDLVSPRCRGRKRHRKEKNGATAT